MAYGRYTNPVYPGYFADPFVWKHSGSYYAVGTGVLEATSHADQASAALTLAGTPGVFTLMRSDDLASWTPLGSALERLDPEFGDAYWAPEVVFAEGRFWLYYSLGRGDKAHHIRVATSFKPEGPFIDTGARITNPFTTPFAIDASPFVDEDGQWYLFYSCDFLDSAVDARQGTGVVVDRFVDMATLAGEPQVVMRARFDWHRFQSERIMYGSRYDWHTIEGPFVCRRQGRYWCLFSAGRWENESYGVDWAVADHPLGLWTYTGSETGARLLRTIPGRVIGPGHNCIVAGPDDLRDYIVYHAWDAKMTARRMCIDPLEWTPSGPICKGPTFTPQELV